MKKNSGFTLLEMLIVLVIVGICAGMAAPSMANLIRKNRIENQIRRVYSDIMNARVMAMTRNRIHFVDFTLAVNRWTVFADTNNNGNNDHAPADTAVLVRGDTAPYGFFNTVPANDVINQNLAGGVVAFSARGIANNSGTIWITVPPNITPFVDCVTVTPIMIRLGKMTGGACASR